MKEYIDKWAVIEEVNRTFDKETLLYSFVRKVAISVLKKFPAADVAPVVHGQWIRGKHTDDDLRYNDYSYRCNRCGKIVDFEENYCPDCGTKMDEGKE